MEQRFPTRQLTAGRPSWRRLLLVSSPAAILCIAGISCLAVDWRNPPSQPCRGISGLFFLAAAVFHTGLLRRVWNGGPSFVTTDGPRRKHLRHWFLSGCILCYAVTILIGPRPGIGLLLLGLLTLWSTICIWVKLRPTSTPEMIGSRAWSKPIRFAGRGAMWALYAAAMTEATLRLHAFVDNDVEARLVVDAIKAQPEAEAFRQKLGATTSTARKNQPHRAFRIAMIGDEVVLCPQGQQHCVSGLERQLPELEIANFGLPMAGPREYQAVLQHEVAAHPADLVLCFISVGSDITEQMPLPGAFDWRGLKICQLADRWANTNVASGLFARSDASPCYRAHHERGDYLEARAKALAVCRSPMIPQMRERWDQVLDHVESISERCRNRGVEFGMVVVPSDFQVNRALCSTLQRRMGYSDKQFDRELPQRRLAIYARRRGMLLLDLLPHLEATGALAFGHNDYRLSKEGAVATAVALRQWIEHGFGKELAAIADSRVEYVADSAHAAMRR